MFSENKWTFATLSSSFFVCINLKLAGCPLYPECDQKFPTCEKFSDWGGLSAVVRRPVFIEWVLQQGNNVGRDPKLYIECLHTEPLDFFFISLKGYITETWHHHSDETETVWISLSASTLQWLGRTLAKYQRWISRTRVNNQSTVIGRWNICILEKTFAGGFD